MSIDCHPLVWLAALGLLSGGCAQPSHLVFHQKTSFGIDASTDTTTGRINVDAGYSRQTNAFVPKTKVVGVDGVTQEYEAMSTISLNDIKVKFLGTHEVNEQFATGKAAQMLADTPDALGQLTTLSDPAPSLPAAPRR